MGILFANCIMQELGADEFNIVFGPAYGAIAFAVITSQVLWQNYGINKPFATMRREAKSYGKGLEVIGAPMAGKRVVILDDLITAGTTKLATYNRIAQLGGRMALTVVGLDCSSDPQVITGLTAATGAPLRALATLDDLARGLGFCHMGGMRGGTGVKEGAAPNRAAPSASQLRDSAWRFELQENACVPKVNCGVHFFGTCGSSLF